MLLLGLLALGMPGLPVAGETPAPALPGFRTLRLAAPPAKVVDGDTFEADLNGDGRLTFPVERVRLLFVDTPELSDSSKGRDRSHGLPARDFLARALKQTPVWLLIPADHPRGKYGRTLALVMAGGANVNLALIEAGHSYFDTRFRFPAEYRRYARAEGEAFDARLGIWKDPPSRERYLERLRRELKTPAARSNALYVTRVHQAGRFHPRGLLGRYVHLTGRVASIRTLRKGVRLVNLQRGPGQAPFPAVAYRNIAVRLGIERWRAGDRVALEGFVKTYHGQPEMVVHYGRVAN